MAYPPFHGTVLSYVYFQRIYSSKYRCRQSLAVEGLGWAEFSLCLFTVFATWIWVSTEDTGSWVRTY
jgi:hypothetical protein